MTAMMMIMMKNQIKIINIVCVGLIFYRVDCVKIKS